MHLLLNISFLCISTFLCKNIYIVETETEEDQDDIHTEIKPLYNASISGDYVGHHDCAGIGLVCTAPETQTIVEGSCIFT